MLERLLSRWRGVAITVTIVVATVFLAGTGKLGLYIHPRYFVFTVVIAVVAGVVCLLAMLLLPAAEGEEDEEEHAHAHAHPPSRTGRFGAAVRSAGTILTVVAVVVALILLPARPLSAATAANRTTAGAGAAAPTVVDPAKLSAADYGSFGVKEWSGLLGQGASAAFLAGKTANLQGFVAPSADGGDSVFLLTRLTITCCAVDAQPVSVPVHLAKWRETLKPGEWVSVSGGFIVNPEQSAAETVVLNPSKLSRIAEPAQPYVY